MQEKYTADHMQPVLFQNVTKMNVNVEEGPVKRTGALGPILSVYIRDPDQNLIELSQYL
ncbi:lactoylglutathione lyase [Bacillus halotolerans]|nr:lactoylglutathione lyase [Bacillus halotolerans]QQF63171.1 lactoylglutathione lyase [Bacillus mojavensis]MBL4963267.1 lactoylglutathione lyase [Bacillus halotolerans]MBL4966846.1 lactoylglutathione lyase [Bacillus halotolerans]MBL4970880.1 lactoylglutathione lyase [Bacillus halotolerans]